MMKHYLFALMMLLVPAMHLAAQEATPQADQPMIPEINDLQEGVPAEFPRFYFANHDESAQYLNRYLWYHFTNRLSNNKTLFNKEYLMVGDMWLAGANDKKREKPIQEVHREDLSGIRQDDEGYVFTHQHFSAAHEHGWPFPLWTQPGDTPEHAVGVTVGWHFNTENSQWALDYLRGWNKPQYLGEGATQGWELINLKANGIADKKWQLEATGPNPMLVTPAGMTLDAFNAPFMQLRWTRTGEPKNHALPYLEWMREGDSDFSPERRVFIHTRTEEWEDYFGAKLCMIEMFKHRLWQGKIKRMRLALAPGESSGKFGIDSFFTVYDTRQSINNPIFILAGIQYFRWTHDLDFLAGQINRLRIALRYQQTEMGGLKYKHIRNTWQGHDGLPGWTRVDGDKMAFHPGHGIGNNYYDLIPFGWDDMYATSQYYASLLELAELEEAILKNPGWNVPRGTLALDPAALRKHAKEVKEEANRLFWNEKTGRFIGSIDTNGKAYDYGFTFVNLEAIWYGIASPEHEQQIMDWISGKRIVAGDTSSGEDIYKWVFGPRCTTLRNEVWYGQGWHKPWGIPFGQQIQDGGAVLGFAFHDLWARLNVISPDDAWTRLKTIMEWEKTVAAGGGYRAYYQDGSKGATLQAGGTAGGIGIDCEFFESSMLPAFVVLGFLGIEPEMDALAIHPRLPADCPEMGIRNLLYQNVRMDVKVKPGTIDLLLKDDPAYPITLKLGKHWMLTQSGAKGAVFTIDKAGTYSFTEQKKE